MEQYLKNVIEMLTERVSICLTEDQAREIVDRTGPYRDEIREGSCSDTAPREVLIDELAKKLTGREAWTYGDRRADPKGYDKWLDDFVQAADDQGYAFIED